MTDLKQNYESEKEELSNQYPDLVSGIEKKQATAEQKQAKINNDLIKKKSKNTGKVLKIEEKKKSKLDLIKEKLPSIKVNKIQENINSGKPPMAGIGAVDREGQKYKPTLLKEEARERYLQVMTEAQTKIVNAQMQLALGSMTIFAKVPYDDGTGNQKTRLELVEDNQLIIDILSNPEFLENKDYFIVKKAEPNHDAIKYILDQTIGKAKDKVEIERKDEAKPDLTKLSDEELKTYIELEKKLNN